MTEYRDSADFRALECENGNEMKARLLGGVFGHCTGDALGLPVEYRSRSYLRENPVINMIGYGTHNQPAGTWSDDSSLMLCALESLCGGIDISDMAKRFVRFGKEGYWTPFGTVFDIDTVTKVVLELLNRGVVGPEESGLSRDDANGNGALIRLLPLVWQPIFASVKTLSDHAAKITAITHANLQAELASCIYLLFGRHLVRSYSIPEAYRRTCHIAAKHFRTHRKYDHFKRIVRGELTQIDEDQIVSTISCVHSLEAAFWCLLHTESFSEAVITAVNLGGDTDTIGAIAGGLAGLHYGAAAIPGRWINALPRKKDIMKLAIRHYRILCSSRRG